MSITDGYNSSVTSLEVSSAAASDPVTTAEAKTHMRVDTSDDDTYIAGLISAATQYAQDRTNRQFINATFKLRLDGFLAAQLWLPRGPLSSITSIQYVDQDDATQTLAGSKYKVDTASMPGRVVRADGQSWPSTTPNPQSVIITYVSGYGSSTSDVPEGIRLAIRMLTAHWYEAREPVIVGSIVAKVPNSVDALLMQYRIPDYR